MRAKGKSKQPRYYCSYTKYRQRQQMAQHLSSFNRKFIELEVWNRYSLLQNDTELITKFTDPKSKQKTNMKWQHKKLLGIFRLVIWVWVPYYGNNTGRLMILLMTFFQERKKSLVTCLLSEFRALIGNRYELLWKCDFPLKRFMIEIEAWFLEFCFTNHVRKFETSNADKNQA